MYHRFQNRDAVYVSVIIALILVSLIIYVRGATTRNAYTAEGQVPFYVSWIIHVHQPYYNVNGSLTQLLNSNDCPEWLPSVWSTRADIYKYYIPWVALNMTGDESLQIDITGTLISQLNELEETKWSNCLYCNWKKYWIEAVNEKTDTGYPRLKILGAGYYHPIFPLIARSGLREDFIEQINRHREIVRSNFGVDVDKGFFLIEEAYTPEIIPLIREAGFEWIVIDSEQLLRATQNYNSQYSPAPNPYDIRNPDPGDWDWGISPQLVFRPHVIEYNGSEIVVFIRYRHMSQAEMSGTNIDYLINQIKHFQRYNTDPDRPFIMVIVHDGENGYPYKEWGGSHGYEYYMMYLTEFIKRIHSDPSLSFIKVIGLTEYLEKVYDPRSDREYKYSRVWAEPGSWETMSTWGDPDFTQWNYPDPASPDQERWSSYIEAVNYYLTAKDMASNTHVYDDELGEAMDWIMRGETSCYYYWDGNSWWDVKALNAFKYSINIARRIMSEVGGRDDTPPTIRWAWRNPYNPDTSVEMYLQVYDLNGVSKVEARIYRGGELVEKTAAQPLGLNNFYKISFTIEQPGIYYVEVYAEDGLGNGIVYSLIRPFYAPATQTTSLITFITESITPPTQPYVMDGELDNSMLIYRNESKKYVKELWVAMSSGYLYIATNAVPTNMDLFIFISTDPWRGVDDAPWLKEGRVANYEVYLGVEGSNGWSGWFRPGDQLLNTNCGSSVGRVVEGYISLSLIGSGEIYIAVAVYDTVDHGKLVETLVDQDLDGDVDPAEFLPLTNIILSTPSQTIESTLINETQSPTLQTTTGEASERSIGNTTLKSTPTTSGGEGNEYSHLIYVGLIAVVVVAVYLVIQVRRR